MRCTAVFAANRSGNSNRLTPVAVDRGICFRANIIHTQPILLHYLFGPFYIEYSLTTIGNSNNYYYGQIENRRPGT